MHNYRGVMLARVVSSLPKSRRDVQALLALDFEVNSLGAIRYVTARLLAATVRGAAGMRPAGVAQKVDDLALGDGALVSFASTHRSTIRIAGWRAP